MKRARWRTVRNAEWTAVFLAVYCNLDALLTRRDSHLFCSAARHHNQMLSAGLNPFSLMPSNPIGAWAEGCRLKTRSAQRGAAPTTRSRMTTRRRLRAFLTLRFSWCRNVPLCWHRAPWAPTWWVSMDAEHGHDVFGHISVGISQVTSG